MLGEIGMLGTASFFAIFLAVGICIRRLISEVESNLTKSFVIGFGAGVVALSLNAILIDVFEASKVAFVLWLLTGATLGSLSLHKKKDINLYSELKKAAVSPYAVIVYLFVATVIIYSPMLSNFFVGDDYTWFRWVADCSRFAQNSCPSFASSVVSYFTNADGFFYRPGTKIFFNLMYSVFWLNQVVYHAVSLFLHFIVASLFFLLAIRILKNNLLAAASSGLFLIMSGYSEAVFWISGIGYLFTAVFALSAILLFALYEEKKNKLFGALAFICIMLGLLFHEVGVVVPLLIILYGVFEDRVDIRKIINRTTYLTMFIPVIFYLIIRFLSGSHWSGGDYSYNLIKLPFNIVGNILGYVLLTIIGPLSLSGYEKIRFLTRENLLIAAVLVILLVGISYWVYKTCFKFIAKPDRKIIIFSALFFVISLLPFLGLGNITSRYAYLASFGLIIIFVLVLKNIYEYLLENGKDIAIGGILVIVFVFGLLHIIELRESHLDWHGAGQRANQFFISINDLFTNEWSKGTDEIHFVDVPIKNNTAWIFPVGLDDAVWFAFKNPEMKVVINSSISEALSQVGYTTANRRIFQFQGDGSLKEYLRPRIVPTIAPLE